MYNKDYFNGKWHYPMEVTEENKEMAGIDLSQTKIVKLGNRTIRAFMVELESEEQYRKLMRPIWAKQKADERSTRCIITDAKGHRVRCMGDCAKCDRSRDGKPLSTDIAEDEMGIEVKDETSDDSIRDLQAAILFDELLDKVAAIDPDCAEALRFVYDGYSYADIAKEIGKSKTAAQKRVEKGRRIAQGFCTRDDILR